MFHSETIIQHSDSAGFCISVSVKATVVSLSRIYSVWHFQKVILSICTGSCIERSVLRVGFVYEQLNSPQQKTNRYVHCDSHWFPRNHLHPFNVQKPCNTSCLQANSATKMWRQEKKANKANGVINNLADRYGIDFFQWHLLSHQHNESTLLDSLFLWPNIFSKDRSNQKHTDNTNISQYKENNGQWWSQDDLRNTVITHTV